MDPFQQAQNQLERKAEQKVSQFTTGCVISIIGAVLVGLVVVGLAGYFFVLLRQESARTGGAYLPSGGAGLVAAGAWSGQQPFTCGGVDNVTIEGVTASLPGATAIEAGGNCRLTLVNVNITAGVPISAGGNANVTVTGGSLTGTQNSVTAGGNSRVTVSGAAVSGAVSRSGFAQVTGVP